jgi:hypothetical protein
MYFEAVADVIGRKYYKNFSNVEDMFGTYAEGTVNKILVVFNETRHKDTTEHQSRIKDKITSDRDTVNEKYNRPYEVRCYGRYFFFSNKANALSIDNHNGERRMIIFRAKSTCKAEEGGFDESDWVYLK